MYHVELRQFPHNLCRFNLTEPEIRAIAIPWVREQPLDIGEQPCRFAYRSRCLQDRGSLLPASREGPFHKRLFGAARASAAPRMRLSSGCDTRAACLRECSGTRRIRRG